MAALPVIMNVVGAIFAGLAIVKIAGHIKDYVTLGWSGEEANKVPAAKSLAKGAFTVIKTGAGLVAKGFRAVVKAGKFVFQGIKRGFMKVVKTFKDLGKKLLARFKFKGFKIVRKGRWFQIFGKINPWILLATGKIEYIEADDLARLNKPKGGRFSTGQTVKVLDEGDEIGGVVVGINRNADDTARRYVEEILKPTTQDELAKLYNLSRLPGSLISEKDVSIQNRSVPFEYRLPHEGLEL